jgi:importin subunit beta-1
MFGLVTLLLPHAQSILELIQRCLSDDESTDSMVKLSYGLLGDLADCFQSGEIKQLLLTDWVASELRSKARMPSETKKTMRWAREVCAVPCRRWQVLTVVQMVKQATA